MAQEALMRIQKGALKNGKWQINLPYHQKQAIFAAVNVHDLQCSVCTKSQLSDALNEVHRRIEIGEVMV
jgi:hypothetical protein